MGSSSSTTEEAGEAPPRSFAQLRVDLSRVEGFGKAECKSGKMSPEEKANYDQEMKDKVAESPRSPLGLDEDLSDMIKIKSGDGVHTIEIDREEAKMSELVKMILEGDDTNEIEIKNVTGDILKHIERYLKHHKGKIPAPIVKPIKSDDISKIVDDKWDAEFINGDSGDSALDGDSTPVTPDVVFQIILGANYMHIQSLIHLGIAKIATIVKQMSPDEIKEILAVDTNTDQDGAKPEQGDEKVNEDGPARAPSKREKSKSEIMQMFQRVVERLAEQKAK